MELYGFGWGVNILQDFGASGGMPSRTCTAKQQSLVLTVTIHVAKFEPFSVLRITLKTKICLALSSYILMTFGKNNFIL